MRYYIELLHDLPVLSTGFLADFSFKEDGFAYSDKVKQMLDVLDEPVYYVFNLIEWTSFSFDDLMTATNIAARTGNSNFRHPMTKAVLLITDDPRLKLAGESLKHPVYGNIDVRVHLTLDDALDAVRAEEKILSE